MILYQYATGWALRAGYGFFHETERIPPMEPEFRECRTKLTLGGRHAYEMYPLSEGRGIVLRTSGDNAFYTHALVGENYQSVDELLMLMKQDCFIGKNEFFALEEQRQRGETFPLLNIDPEMPEKSEEYIDPGIKRVAAYAAAYLWRNSEENKKTPCAIRVFGKSIEEQVDSFYHLLWSHIPENIKKRIGVCFGVRWEERGYLPKYPDCFVETEDVPDAVPMFDLTTGEMRLGEFFGPTHKAIVEGIIEGALPEIHETAAKISGSVALEHSYRSVFTAKQIEMIPESVSLEQQYDRLLDRCSKYVELLKRFKLEQEPIKQIMLSVERRIPPAWKLFKETKSRTGSNISEDQHSQFIARALAHVLKLPKENDLRKEYISALQEYVGTEQFKLLLDQCIQQKCPGRVFEEILDCKKALSKDAVLMLVESEKAARSFEPDVAAVNSKFLNNGLLLCSHFADFSTEEKAFLLTRLTLSVEEHKKLLNIILASFGDSIKEVENLQKKITDSDDKELIKDHLSLLYLKQLKEKKQPKELEKILEHFSDGDYRQDRLTNLLTICADIPLDSSLKEKLLKYSDDCAQHGIKDDESLFTLFEKQPDKACMLAALKARNYTLHQNMQLPNWQSIRRENFVATVKQRIKNKKLSDLIAYRKNEFASDCSLCPDERAIEQKWEELESVLLPEMTETDLEIAKESSLEAIQACLREIQSGSLQKDWLGTHISHVLFEKNMLYKVYNWNVNERSMTQGVALLNELAEKQVPETVRKSIGSYLRSTISVYPERPTKQSLICGLLASTANLDGFWEKYPSGKKESSDAANALWEKDGPYLLQISGWTLRTLKSLAVNKSYIQSYTRVKLLGAKKAKAELSKGMIRKKCKLFDQTDALHELRDIISEK